MDFKDKFNQKELGYVYDRGKDLAKAYPDLAEKYRKMIPLKMVYIPVAKEDSESL